MSRTGASLAALVLGLLTCAPLQASHGHHGHHGHHRVHHYRSRSAAYSKAYLKKHGRHFKHGWYYAGRHHRHWAWSYYNPRWRTTFYFDPAVETYFYWYAPLGRFYPESYLEVAPPIDDPGILPEEDESE
jgi:hypothetical protein